MKLKTVIATAAAVAVTLLFVFYQRKTGPTYPVRGEVNLSGNVMKYKLLRSQNSGSEAEVAFRPAAEGIKGTIAYRRFPTGDPFTAVPMEAKDGALTGSLPTQPPAGKLEYQVMLEKDGAGVQVPERPVVIRFKGAVPAAVLVPHVLLIFLGLLFSSRACVKSLMRMEPMGDSVAAFAVLLVGGLILGPIVQKYAFGAFWTGWPFGTDWTDNKTFFAVAAWVPAIFAMRWQEKAKRIAPVLAFLVVIVAFGIPHSFRGSQLDWSKIPNQNISGR